ncbi:MAG: phosphate--nucleotide phosphotransferase [Actinobacteria bacterium HGW-Actinobacteria-4]|nr:MAG: phosphate--nucleotide phosphotransferase [Actinobacteria bacterium HGW-Actinobacteria-4]
MTPSGWTTSPSESLRVGPGFVLTDVDARSTPGFEGTKADGATLIAERGKRLSDLQEMLYANGRQGDPRSVLVVLQGMDASGKGGIARNVLGMVDPQGVHVTGFGKPTPEELAHHFLWRIENALPVAGDIGLFDRSHYEDVLVARVLNLVPAPVWEARYGEINAWEQRLTNHGVVVIKCVMVLSKEEQLERLAARLEDPHKHWKYSTSDLDDRALWDDYHVAYQAVLDRCTTDAAPWYAVPADRKWFARLAVTELLIEALEGMNLAWPVADFDVEEERARIAQLRTTGG